MHLRILSCQQRISHHQGANKKKKSEDYYHEDWWTLSYWSKTRENPYPETVYTGWSSVYWNTIGMRQVDPVYSVGESNAFWQRTLKHDWKTYLKLCNTGMHWRNSFDIIFFLSGLFAINHFIMTQDSWNQLMINPTQKPLSKVPQSKVPDIFQLSLSKHLT